MRLGPSASNIPEWIALRLDLAPIPIVDTQIAMTAARAIMAGSSLGLFDAIAGGAHTVEAIAAACHTNPRATRALVDALVGIEYLEKSGDTTYVNSRRVERWIVSSSPRCLKDKLAFQEVEWRLLGGLEAFVRTGAAIDMHATLDAASYARYQRGMRALAAGMAPVVARHIPVPRGARRLLDIGGSHGLYSVALCRRHRELRAEVLELAAALPVSAELLDLEKMGRRVIHRSGDALTDDLGEATYDVVLVVNLVHHFDAAQNIALARRVARALAPRGMYVIVDLERAAGAALGGMLDLYFALTSTSGTWTAPEMQQWQRDAGLRVRAPVRPRLLPGYVIQSARKVARS